MIIQCPACGLQAKLPDSKEGAKVRCTDCGRVYVARPPGARAPRKEDPTKYVVIGVVAVLVLAVFLWVKNQPDREVVAQTEEPEETVVHEFVDSTGWDSPLVKLGREFHDILADRSTAEMRFLTNLDPEYVYRHQNEAELPEDEEPPAEEPAPLAEGAEPWASLSETDRQKVLRDAIAGFFDGEDAEEVAAWTPHDGWVVSESDTIAVIRLKVSNRDDPTELDRHIEWRFVKRAGKWKGWYWERWYSPEELAAIRAKRKGKTTKKTLSDGSLVIEGEKRVLGHLDETPQEVRDQIDRLIGDLLDIDARPKVYTAAQAGLKEIGRPAIPPLLSQLAEHPLETDEDAMRLQRVHMLLTEMTGYRTTFDVHDAMGGSKERRESGLKQWFGWYDRKWRKYKGPEDALSDDPLMDLKARSEKEQREFDRIRSEQGGGR